jgi:hypothetical protein
LTKIILDKRITGGGGGGGGGKEGVWIERDRGKGKHEYEEMQEVQSMKERRLNSRVQGGPFRQI